MPIEVEVSLRIPNGKVRPLDASGYPIDYSAFRFKRRVQIPSLPKPGDVLQIENEAGPPVPCEVVRTDWSEEHGLFILACKYAGRSMPADARDAVVSGSAWKMSPLI